MKKTVQRIKLAHETISRDLNFKAEIKPGVEVSDIERSSPTKIRGSYHDEPVIKREGNVITEVRLSSTLLRKMYWRFEKRDFCPKKIYELYIAKTTPSIQTESMMKGSYFEAHCLGETADEEKPWEWERKRDGKKYVDIERIDEQIEVFPEVCEKYGIIIQPDGESKNIQIVDHKQWGEVRGVKIMTYMTYDIVSPITYMNKEYEAAIIDLKLTIDRKSERLPYAWGAPHLMDHIQGFIYSFGSGLPFFYLLFDYNSKDRGHKLIPVNTNINHSIKQKANEASLRKKETEETLRKVTTDILTYEEIGWHTEPSYQNCDNCPVVDCPDRGANAEV